MQSANSCPLCGHAKIDFYHKDKKREYLQCQQCQLVFVDPGYLPSTSQEKQEYDLHQNSEHDSGYRTFLSRLSTPLLSRIKPCSTGLDFGCGPGPALHLDFEEMGHKMALYDPIYQPCMGVFQKRFDFITCTEAIEHFHRPAKEWQQWLQMLRPNAWLAIMTKRLIDKPSFTTWHYKNDQTHVCFFSDFTFEWLAHRDNLKLEFLSKDIVLMQKLP